MFHLFLLLAGSFQKLIISLKNEFLGTPLQVKIDL